LENKPDKASCSGCYVSLEGVTPTEAKEKPAPVKAQPSVQQPPAAQPLAPSGPAVGGETPGPNYGPPPNYGPAPGGPSYSYGPTNEKRTSPIKPGVNWGAIVFVILLVGAAGFAGWWFFLKPSGPEAVVQRMLDASKQGDWDTFKSCFSQSTISALSFAPGGEEGMKQSFKSGQDDVDKIMQTTYENDGNTAIIVVETTASRLPAGKRDQELVVLRENGQWRVDLISSMARAMKKMFPNGMPGMRRPGM